MDDCAISKAAPAVGMLSLFVVGSWAYAQPSSALPKDRSTAATFAIESELDKKAVARTRQAAVKRDEAIRELKKLIHTAPPELRAEMIFRLAELFWEKSRYLHAMEMERYEAQHRARAHRRADEEAIDLAEATKASELVKVDALKLYRRVLEEDPKYARNDEVLFYLAHNEYQAGNRDAAVEHYTRLTRDFPKSRLIPDVYLQLGEHHFNHNELEPARVAYQRALETRADRVFNYALYKLAWCDYNARDYTAGLDKLKQVIARASEAASGNAIQLKAEAVRDLARFFSFVNEVGGALKTFERVAKRERVHSLGRSLAGFYREQGKWKLEIEVSKRLLRSHPNHEKAPRLQADIVEAYSKLLDNQKVRQEVERLVDTYAPGTPWYKRQKGRGKAGEAALAARYALTESRLRDLVTEYHRFAQERKNVSAYRLARDIYQRYLKAFPDAEASQSMRFFYAEVLWALKEWKAAAEQYTEVAQRDLEGKKAGKYTRRAAYDAILAWEKIVVEGPRGQLGRKKKVKERKKKGRANLAVVRRRDRKLDKKQQYKKRTIPEVERRLSAACDLYFKLADSKDKDLPAIKFKAAYILYKYNHFASASERYNEVIAHWPRHSLSKRSAHLIIDALNVQQRWKALSKTAYQFSKNRALVGRDSAFKKELLRLAAGAEFKLIQSHEESARAHQDERVRRRLLAKTARAFVAYEKKYRRTNFASRALMNAVLLYDQAEQLDHALQAAASLKERYPQSELRVSSDFLAAGWYGNVGAFEEAAKSYRAFARNHPNDKRAQDALYNAGVFFENSGRTAQAIKQFRRYLAKFPSVSDAWKVHGRVCALLGKGKKNKETALCYRQLFGRFKKLPSGSRFLFREQYALVLERMKKRSEARKIYRRLRRSFPNLSASDRASPLVRRAAARAAFLLIEPDYLRFVKAPITLKPEVFRKKRDMALALACVGGSGGAECKRPGRYLSVLKYKDAHFGIAALTRIGMVFRNMAEALRNAPVPRHVTGGALEIYRAEVDELALGPEAKAIEALQRALTKAYELHVYGKWTRLAQKNLEELSVKSLFNFEELPFRGRDAPRLAAFREVSP